MIERGTIIRSLKGRNKGSLAAVLSCDERFVYIADGKEYKTARPKPKNPKHIQPTGETLGENIILHDAKLRKALNKVNPK